MASLLESMWFTLVLTITGQTYHHHSAPSQLIRRDSGYPKMLGDALPGYAQENHTALEKLKIEDSPTCGCCKLQDDEGVAQSHSNMYCCRCRIDESKERAVYP